jgi:hypothetical protein
MTNSHALSVYTYAEALRVPITNETAMQLNTLCQADPFSSPVSCVVLTPNAISPQPKG